MEKEGVLCSYEPQRAEGIRVTATAVSVVREKVCSIIP